MTNFFNFLIIILNKFMEFLGDFYSTMINNKSFIFLFGILIFSIAMSITGFFIGSISYKNRLR